ncbi:PKD domain-containing protein [Bacteroidota bacterium]
MKKLWFFLIVFLLSFSLRATHQYGAELTYTCVGQDSFLVKYVYYRDCNGINGSAGSLVVKCAATGTTINSYTLSFTSTTDITNLCPGVDSRCVNSGSSFPYGLQKLEALKLIDLSSAGSCCEILLENYGDSRLITTNINSGGGGIYVSAMLNRCLTPCDNSPQFTNLPILLLEVNKDFNYNHGVVDEDLDSISFEWSIPLEASSQIQISYKGSFTYDKPLSFWGFPNASLPYPRGYHLDKITGDIAFRPMIVEGTTVVLKVSEWRLINDTMKKIGDVRRDMSILVTSGAGNNSPAFTSSPNAYHVCAGDTLELTINSSDADAGDTVRLQLNSKPPNSSWSDNNGQVRLASGNLIWATDTSDINNQPYILNVSAFDDNCPVKGQYSKSFLIYVDPQPSAQLEIVKSNCNLYHLNSMHRKYVNQLKWYIGGQLYASTLTCYFNVTQPGTYPVCMELFGGTCSQKIYDTLFVPQLINVVLPPDTVICKGESILIQSSISDSTGKVNYSWNSGDTTSSIQLGPIYHDTLLILNVSDSLYCDVDSIWVKVDQFDQSLTQDTITCPGNPVILKAIPLFDEGKQTTSFKWLDVSCTCPQGYTDQIIVYMPGIYSCETLNDNGCMVLDTIVVEYNTKPQVSFLPIPDICLNDADVVLDSFVYPMGGTWYGQDTTIVKNNLFQVKKATEKPYLLFYSYTHPVTNCFSIEKTTVEVKDYPRIYQLQDFSFCKDEQSYNLDSFVAPAGGQWSVNYGIKFGHFFFPEDASMSQSPLVYTIVDTNGCDNTKQLAYYLNPLPDVDFEADMEQGKVPLTVSFTNNSTIAEGTMNYLWHFGDGDSSILENPDHTYLNVGKYDVNLQAMSDSGCATQLMKFQLIDALNSIVENDNNTDIHIYPVPANAYFVIEAAGNTRLSEVLLVDVLGQPIALVKELSQVKIRIERNKLPSGTYFIRITDVGGYVTLKKILLE